MQVRIARHTERLAEIVRFYRDGIVLTELGGFKDHGGLRKELWEVELDGDVLEGERLVAARRGRLVRRVEEWDEAVAKAIGTACAVEARRRVAVSPDLEEYAADAEGTAEGSPQFAAFAAARLAELQDGVAGYAAERARQARWLADELRLTL